MLRRHPSYHIRLERHLRAVGLCQKLRPIEVVRSLFIYCLIFGFALLVGYIEVDIQARNRLVIVLICIVHYGLVVVGQGIGIVGTEGYHLGEIASDAGRIVVFLHRYHAEIEVGVGGRRILA